MMRNSHRAFSCVALLIALSFQPAPLLAAVAATQGSARTSAPLAQDIVGLWSYKARYPTGPSGQLTIIREGSSWSATLGGLRASASAAGSDIRLSFPGGSGTFRGTLRDGALSGFWVRREVPEDPRYPGAQSRPYATPLGLRPVGRGRWQAIVQPLEDTFTLYLAMSRDAGGSLKAAFRNPETNSHGRSMQFDAALNGDSVQFTARPNPARPEIRLDARLLRNPDRLAIRWPDLDGTIELTRIAPERSERFFPRPPGAAPYTYRAPPMTGDGWQVARASELGLDEAALARAVQRILDFDPASPDTYMIHSIAVAYRGKLVLDEYFYGYGRDEPHDTRSASKALSSVILGAMMNEGADISPASLVYDIMAPRGPFANPDPRKAQINLGHLLTHSSGLACDDNAESPVSPGNEDAMMGDRTRPDWVRNTLDLPMQFQPGEHYAYCSMNINLAASALSQKSGEWLPALFDRTVARPLQFGPYHWLLMPNGEGYLGGGVFMRTRDFLKIGQAYMNGGLWNDRRIATAAFARDAWTGHMRISPATTGLSGEDFENYYFDVDEGWGWHMVDVQSGDRSYPAIHTNGNGGQLLLVMPQFELAVMFTGGSYRTALWNFERDGIVGRIILPAILKARSK